jgi:dGTPase
MGEAVLNELLPGGFRHYEQSLRIVERIENKGKGLNLTWEVRDGILNHSKGDLEILECGWDTVSTVEGQVVKMADMVAYINHDVEDAMRADLISPADLPYSTARVLGQTNSSRINTLVTDIVQFSADKLIPEKGAPFIGMSNAIRSAANELREFLFTNVYYANREKEEGERARRLLVFLYNYFVRNPDNLPPEYNLPGETIERRVADYVSGMSDQYAILTSRKFSETPIW